VFTSSSPWASAIAMDRIGGITTLPLANMRNACSTTSTVSTPRCTASRNWVSVRITMSRMVGCYLQFAELDRAAGDNVGERVHVDVAAADDQGRGPVERQLAGQQGRNADRADAFGDQAVVAEQRRHAPADLL